MQLDTPFSLLDIKPSNELLNFDYNTIDWSIDTVRQTSHPNHQDTLTFPFIKSPFSQYGEITLYNENYSLFPVVMKEVKKLEDHFNAKARTVVLAGVIPFGKIPSHKDESQLFHLAHRCHLPLVTTETAIFTIDNVEYNFKKGEWVEIDNRRVHSVFNNDSNIRVHLLVDLMPCER